MPKKEKRCCADPSCFVTVIGKSLRCPEHQKEKTKRDRKAWSDAKGKGYFLLKNKGFYEKMKISALDKKQAASNTVSALTQFIELPNCAEHVTEREV